MLAVRPRPVWRLRLALLPVLLLVLGITAWVASFSIELIRADFATMASRQQISRCASTSSTWAPSDWQRAEGDMLQGVRLSPGNPAMHDMLALLYTCRGVLDWADEADRSKWFKLARQASETSLRLRPNHAASLASLAVAIQASGGSNTDMNTAWQAALRFGPNDVPAHTALFDLALRTWDTATPGMRAWVQDQYRQAPPDKKKRLADWADRLGRKAVLQ